MHACMTRICIYIVGLSKLIIEPRTRRSCPRKPARLRITPARRLLITVLQAKRETNRLMDHSTREMARRIMNLNLQRNFEEYAKIS